MHYETIRLPHEGNWSYTWEDLDTNHKWSVKEDKVTGYKDPKITREGNIFYVKNILNKPKLPQTGQLNWPVPVMAVTGLTLFAIGWTLCFGRNKEKMRNKIGMLCMFLGTALLVGALSLFMMNQEESHSGGFHGCGGHAAACEGNSDSRGAK